MHGTTHSWSFRVPPGWPVPPQGWTPRQGWEPDPSWPAAPQDWLFWVPVAPTVPAQRRSAEDYWATPPRAHRNRVVLMALSLLGVVGGWFALSVAVLVPFAFRIDPADYPTEAAYDQAWDNASETAMPIVMGVLLAANLLLFGILGQRAGYRGAGFLLVLVPVWGYVVMCRLLWRWTDIKHWQHPAPAAVTYLPPPAPIGLPHHQRTF